MNSLSARVRAIAVTLLAFAIAAGLAGGLFWAIAQVDVLAGLLPAALPQPGNWIELSGAMPAIRLLVALVFVIGAVVLVFSSAYLDRMFEIFGDVLLMVMAALAGTATGAWGFVRIMGSDRGFPVSAFIPLLLLFAILFVVLLLVPRRARSGWGGRLLAIIAMLGAAPLVLTLPILS